MRHPNALSMPMFAFVPWNRLKRELSGSSSSGILIRFALASTIESMKNLSSTLFCVRAAVDVSRNLFSIFPFCRFTYSESDVIKTPCAAYFETVAFFASGEWKIASLSTYPPPPPPYGRSLLYITTTTSTAAATATVATMTTATV